MYASSLSLFCTYRFFTPTISFLKGVLEDVEKEFEMDQEWMGGLIQTAFIICYFIGAPAFGYLGDRYSRKWLIILGIVMWSSSIMVSSFMPVRSNFKLNFILG